QPGAELARPRAPVVTAYSWQGESGLPLQTPSVLAQKVAALPAEVVTRGVWRRLATTQSARRSRAYSPRLTKLDLSVNMPRGYWAEVSVTSLAGRQSLTTSTRASRLPNWRTDVGRTLSRKLWSCDATTSAPP